MCGVCSRIYNLCSYKRVSSASRSTVYVQNLICRHNTVVIPGYDILYVKIVDLNTLTRLEYLIGVFNYNVTETARNMQNQRIYILSQRPVALIDIEMGTRSLVSSTKRTTHPIFFHSEKTVIPLTCFMICICPSYSDVCEKQSLYM